ncbi:MAG: TaqI-like C-terminal specificity domain-containing protein, partial [Candidatus Hodarchaeota archaeon]
KVTPGSNHYFSYYDANFKLVSTPLQHLISAENKYQFEVFDPTILHMIAHSGKLELGQLCKVQVGYNTGGHKDFFESEKGSDNFPFVSGGGSIQPYSLTYPSIWQKKTGNYFLVYNPQLVKKVIERAQKQNKGLPGFGDKEGYFDDEKLFLRQSGSSLSATYDDQKFRSRHNLFIINFNPQIPSVLLSEKKKYLKTVLAQLNSDLLTYYAIHRRLLLTGQGKIPQITANSVRKLPILQIPEKAALVFLVDSLLSLKKYNPADITTFELINNFLNMCIYEFFLFSSVELLKIIQEKISAFNKSEDNKQKYVFIKGNITHIMHCTDVQQIFDKVTNHPLIQRIIQWKENRR